MDCPLGKCNESNCVRKAVCKSKYKLLQGRYIRQNRESAKQKRKDNEQEFKGQYMGFNAANKTHIVQKIDGSILEVSGITNGQIIQGQMVSGIIPKYGSRGIISGMPTS